MAVEVRPIITEYIKSEFVKGDTGVDVDSANLLEEEIIDSLGIFTLVSFIEDKFGVSVEPEEVNLDNFETVSAVTTLVEGKL
ncbi:MAG: acyl carrier protein [Acidimicrobiia bacterium]|nr:acyl carrier protein [Acidimicrobiia bacterium]